jgi:hypothetical protein
MGAGAVARALFLLVLNPLHDALDHEDAAAVACHRGFAA